MSRAAAAAVLALAALTAPPALAAVPPPPTATYNLLQQPATGTRLFLKSCTSRAVVDSAYLYEASLLDYSTPVADIDYMLPYAAQCVVSLPGFASDHYLYAGSEYVAGSGWVLKFRTPNGGRFAFLHIGRPYTATAAAPRIPLPPRHGSAVRTDGDENTARAVGSLRSAPRGLQLAVYPGGAAVGVSQWPTDPFYGNGSYGPADAHLCFLLDQAAADWFYAIGTGSHKPPPHPFRLAIWNAWRLGHHQPLISPWDGHGHLIWAGAIFKDNRWLGGVKDRGTWYGPSRRAHRRYGFTQTEFAHGCVDTWPHYHRGKASHGC